MITDRATDFRRAISGTNQKTQKRDAEAGQALVRIIIAVLFAIYVLWGVTTDRFSEKASDFLSIYIPILLFFSVGMALDIRRRPGVYHLRRAICMALDFGSITMVMVLGGLYMAPIFAVLLSVTVGYGMRYGPRYLALATVVGLLCLAVLALISPAWSNQPFTLGAFALSLVFVPLYANALLADTKEAHRIAAAANLAKARFLSHASHDLRQPVHAIGLFTNFLHEAKLAPTEQKMVDNIDHSLRTVTRMLNSLFDIATLDSGKITVRPKPVSLGELIRDVVYQYDTDIRRAKVDLHWVDNALVANTDSGLLTIMVQNLVSNAIKYADNSKILIGCRRHGNTASLWVIDQGAGIAPEHHQRIFDEFYRVPSPGKDIEGIGLGLTILQRMANLIGAKISFASNPGRGTAVGICGLPLTNRAIEPETAAVLQPKSLLNGTRVVLIEDDSAVLLSTKMLMERWGCIVEPCQVPTADVGHCDMIVADFDLNGPVSGGDAINMIRSQQGWQIPAVIVTAHDTDKIREQLGEETLPILLKPVRPTELRSVMLGQLVHLRRSGGHL